MRVGVGRVDLEADQAQGIEDDVMEAERALLPEQAAIAREVIVRALRFVDGLPVRDRDRRVAASRAAVPLVEAGEGEGRGPRGLAAGGHDAERLTDAGLQSIGRGVAGVAGGKRLHGGEHDHAPARRGELDGDGGAAFAADEDAATRGRRPRRSRRDTSTLRELAVDERGERVLEVDDVGAACRPTRDERGLGRATAMSSGSQQ